MTRKIKPDDIVGAHEIAERLNLSFPNVVHNWRKRYPDFPEPIRELSSGLLWDWTAIEDWARSTGRLE